MIELKNRNNIIEELTEMLMQFDKLRNNYQTDVYLYLDKEKQTAKLYTFVNVGGNSWLDDDHYIIYSDKEHYESVFENFENKQDLLAVASNYDFAKSDEILHQIIEKIADESEEDVENISPEDVFYEDIRSWIENNEQMYNAICEAHEYFIDERRPDYVERAELIISEWESEMEN